MIKKLLEDLQPRAVLEYNAAVTINKFRQPLLKSLAEDNTLGLSAKKWFPIPEDEAAQDKILEQLLTKLEEGDPTKNKEYMVFIAKAYAAGGWGAKLEDILSKVKPALVKFDRLKKKNKLEPADKDILKFKDFWSFTQKVDAYPDELIEDETVNRGKHEEFFENDQVRIVVPLDQTASCYYGRNTKWCTASTQGYNYFDSYSSRGKLYIFLPKKPEYPGEKYQMHVATNSFMNEKDISVDEAFILVDRFGDLIPVFSKVSKTKYGLDILYWKSNKEINRLINLAIDIAKSQGLTEKLAAGVNKTAAASRLISKKDLVNVMEAINKLVANPLPVVNVHQRGIEQYWLKKNATTDTFANFIGDYLTACDPTIKGVVVPLFCNAIRDTFKLSYDKKTNTYSIIPA